MTKGTGPTVDLERLLADARPELHRYCARMVGSAFDGEDVVQEALAKAAEAWSAASEIERPRSWLFRIAHNASLDHLRRSKRRAAFAARLNEPAVGEGADARVAAAASLATLMRLPPLQRSCIVLVDVLGHSLEETLEILAITAPAAKAALRRGRLRLRALAKEDRPPPLLDPEAVSRLRDYADRFNARDFDALRALLAEDVQLDLVARVRLRTQGEVAKYFTRYGELSDWWFAPGLAEGRPILLGRYSDDPTDMVRWVVLLDWRGNKLVGIRDFRHACYVVDGLTTAPL